MDELRAKIAEKKAELDALRAGLRGSTSHLDHAVDLELTYASNAIEGNTLTQIETNLVIDEGLTIGGKPLRDHLEAIDHFDAIGFVRDLAKRNTPIGEWEVRSLHALVLKRSAPDMAGRYATSGRFVNTDRGRHAFPSPAEIPALMGDFGGWLGMTPADYETAFAAHKRLVDIHPFEDGNGRTARLLMNLILLRCDYPAVSVRPEHRLAYLRALQGAQTVEGDAAFTTLMLERLDTSLDETIAALRETLP